MTIELKLPELGENITSGKVIAVLVNVGETIAVDQSVIEVETDKALIEVPSSVGGKITEIHLNPATTLKWEKLFSSSKRTKSVWSPLWTRRCSRKSPLKPMGRRSRKKPNPC